MRDTVGYILLEDGGIRDYYPGHPYMKLMDSRELWYKPLKLVNGIVIRSDEWCVKKILAKRGDMASLVKVWDEYQKAHLSAAEYDKYLRDEV